MTGKRLYKARGQRMVCGVCGGLAEYFGIDPTLVRLAFLLLAAGWGSGLLAYIVAAIIIPEPPADPYREKCRRRGNAEFKLTAGGALRGIRRRCFRSAGRL